MLSREEVIAKAVECGFEDTGFTTAEPFDAQRAILEERREEYRWASAAGIDLIAGTDPRNILPGAKSIIVLMEAYFREAFPASLERHFGRCYLDDDRMLRNRLGKRVKAFRSFLRDHGIDSKVPFHLPHRMAAARAGLGTFGKNCLFYSRRVAAGGSWVLPIAVVVDQAFPPDEPTFEIGCPDWCRNACLAACPTGALRGPQKIDPRRCISFLTYFGSGLTPREMRAPMGLNVYGCDRCQNVCPRNAPWLARELKANEKAAGMAGDFRLEKLLRMDKAWFTEKIWPHMFYMPPADLWRWKMNVARAIGNTRDEVYVPELAEAYRREEDERVKAMAAWALGRIGGPAARQWLDRFLPQSAGLLREEIIAALEASAPGKRSV
ncbi:MAG: 4Fe-4S double cluster binding domain-containing protein [Syntrophales bacterium]|nr:4Fe-4S double cluster binding domain-containing protein [Syntrophales bacterium]